MTERLICISGDSGPYAVYYPADKVDERRWMGGPSFVSVPEAVWVEYLAARDRVAELEALMDALPDVRDETEPF